MSQDVSSRLKLFRKYHFYRDLCDELLSFAQNILVRFRMSERKRMEVGNLRRRYDEIRMLDDDKPALWNMKTLAADITRFYVRRYPLRCCASRTSAAGVINWRWLHLTERAHRWQEIARTHDWSDDLQIQPRFPSEEDWWDRTPSSAVSLFAADNPYSIAERHWVGLF